MVSVTIRLPTPRNSPRSLVAALVLFTLAAPTARLQGDDFIRGDSNGDGVVDISDPVAGLGFLFLGSRPAAATCPDAMDADDDGVLNITDAIYALGFLFLGGRPIPPPGRECGPDPTPEDPLGCELFSLCGPSGDAPQPSFRASTEGGAAPLEVIFDASASVDPGGRIVSYTWTFGDGARGDGVIVSHVFETEGEFVVTLRVRDDTGAEATSQATVSVVGLRPTFIAGTSPDDGEASVAVTRETIARFVRPIRAASVSADAIVAQFGGDILPGRLHTTPGRALVETVTLFYDEPLPPSARVRVTIDGDLLLDERGEPVDADGDGVAGGRGTITFDTLGLTLVPGTSVCGRLFASELGEMGGASVNVPLEGVTITVDGAEDSLFAVTDAMGDFRLEPAPSGRFFVHVVGRTATNGVPPGAYYPYVGKAWESVPGEETPVGDAFLPLVVPGTLQALDDDDVTEITFAPPVLAEFPELEGVSVFVEPGSLYFDDGSRGRMVEIAPVAPDRLPGMLPPGMDPPLVITVQTDGATNFDVPVAVCFPNLPDPSTGERLPPGASTALASFNHDTGSWEIVGSMTVGADGGTICTDPGVGILAPGWHGVCRCVQTTGGRPTSGGGGQRRRARHTSSYPPKKNDGDADSACAHGCKVYLHSGEENLSRVDLRIPGRGEIHFVMARTYRSHLDYDGPLGFGWDFAYNDSLFPEPGGDLTRCDGAGYVDRWSRRTDGGFDPPEGDFRSLVREPDGTLVLRSPSGFKRRYHPDGRLQAYVDRFGNSMLFEYDARGNLDLVIDAYGREIDFVFETLPDGVDRLVKVRDFIGREIQYSYDAPGDLVTVRSPIVTGTSTGNNFPAGRTERYTYSTGFADPRLNHNLLSVTMPEEVARGGPPAITWVYGTDPANPLTLDRVLEESVGGGRVNASGVPAGGTTRYLYAMRQGNSPLAAPDVPEAVGMATIIERNGRVLQYFADANDHHIESRRLTRPVDASGVPRFEHRDDLPANLDFYRTRSFFDADGQLVRRVFPEGNEVRYTYGSGSRGAQQNLVAVRQVAGPRGDGQGGSIEDIVTTYAYEPLYNQVASVTDPRGNSATFVPPLGVASAARYTTRLFFDYQEGSSPVADAVRFGIDLSGVPRGLGDLNGDGRTDQTGGNVVRSEAPSVRLVAGSNEAARRGSTVQSIVAESQWNDHGQMTKGIDAEGNVTLFEYYPENDPDGDGTVVSSVFKPLDGGDLSGYLKSVSADAENSPRRSTTVPPLALRSLLGYDPVGNVVSLRNPRGITTRIEVNRLNEPVAITRGAEVSAAVASGELVMGEAPFRFLAYALYDHNGRVVRIETEDRATFSTTAGVGQFVEETLTYDLLGNLVARTREIDAGPRLTWEFGYDPDQLATSVVEPEGNEHRVRHDERKLLFETTLGFGSPDASTSRVSYDLNGNVLRVTDAEDNDGDGAPESFVLVHDGFDRRRVVIDSLGNELHTDFDPAGNTVSARLLGHRAGLPGTRLVRLLESFHHHDEVRRIYQVDQALFLSEGFTTVRAADLRDQNSDGLVTKRFEFDALSRLSVMVEDDGEVTARVYDGASRLIRNLLVGSSSTPAAVAQSVAAKELFMRKRPRSIALFLVASCTSAPLLAQSAFLRGDANADGAIDVGDPLATLFYTVSAGALPCSDAADANDSETIDTTDAVFLVTFIFQSGPPPAAPFPRCGLDPDGDALGCEAFAPCPQDPEPTGPEDAVVPARANLWAGGTERFSAVFSDGGDALWSVENLPGVDSGSIDASGVYTAPPAVPDAPIAVVRARSSLDPALTATASVLLLAADEVVLTRDQAIRRVVEEVITPSPNRADVIAYATQEPLQPGDRIVPFRTPGDEGEGAGPAIHAPCWFFMIDEAPGARFAHPVRYVFVDCVRGARTEKRERYFPLINGDGVWGAARDPRSSPDRVFVGASAAEALAARVARPAAGMLAPGEGAGLADSPVFAPPPPDPGCACPGGPQKLALVAAGVEDVGILTADSFLPDVEAMRDALIQVGFQVKTVSGVSGGITGDTVVRDIRALRGQLRPCDLFLFFYSGHGSRLALGVASGEAIMSMSGPPSGDSRDLLYGRLASERSAVVARRKIVIIDACEAEGLRLAFEAGGNPVVGTEMLMASDRDGYAYGGADGALYTQALLACLPDAADLAAAHACAVLSVKDTEDDQNPQIAFTDPNDSDNDGLSDTAEDRIGTDPANADSDGDGECDGLESLRLRDDASDVDGLQFRPFPHIVTPNVQLDSRGEILSDDDVLVLPTGLVDAPYPPFAVRTLFGTPPFRYSQAGDVGPPEGLTIGPDGVFSGTVGVSGDFEFIVAVTDAVGAKDFKRVRLTVLPGVAPGAFIDVSTNADNTAADDDITLREAILLASGGTGPLGLGRPLRPDPDPDDGVPAGEERHVQIPSGAGPGLAFQDFVQSFEALGEIVLTQGPLVHVADGDSFAIASAIRAQSGPVLEVRGNGNQLGAATLTGPLAGGEPAVLVTGSDNRISLSVRNASGTAIVIDGGAGNEILSGILEDNLEGVRLTGGASSNRIDRLGIRRSGGDAVVITDRSAYNTVETCGIGVRVSEVAVAGNAGHGILIDGGARFNEVIGNTIVDSAGSGIRVEGAETAFNELSGNSIGGIREGNGLRALAPNRDHGIVLAGGTYYNTVRGNILLENVGHGVLITGAGTSFNTVIGPVVTQANTRDGIRVEAGTTGTVIGGGVTIRAAIESGIAIVGSTGNTVAGDLEVSFGQLTVDGAQGAGILLSGGAARNFIRAVTVVGCGDGIVVEGAGTDDNVIADALVRNNTHHGVLMQGGCRRNRVDGEGSSDPAAPDFRAVNIGSNGGSSVVITGAGTSANEVRRSVLGDRRDGAHAVEITDGASENLVSGCGIVEHALGGVLLRGAGTTLNLITQNIISGAIFPGEIPLSGAGVIIDGGARGNLVLENEIVFNGQDGVRIVGGETRENVIGSNRIGGIEVFEIAPGNTIEVALPNLGNGVLIEDAPENIVGSPFGGGNTIAGNVLNGLQVLGTVATGNRITGNLIGTETGERAAPNGLNGFSVTDGARGNTIGGVRPVFNPLVPALPLAPDLANLGAANLISGNAGSGVRVSDPGVVRNKVLGNLIGFSFGATPLANGGDGVTVSTGAADNCIGDCLFMATRDPGHANIIVDHPGAGVLVSDAASTGNTISRARIARNTQDILLAAGANGGLEPPAITSFDPVAGRIAGVAPGEGILEVFTDFPGDEGAFHLAAFVEGGAFTIDALGGASQNAVIFETAQPLRPGVLRMTFTDREGNTSQFAVAR